MFNWPTRRTVCCQGFDVSGAKTPDGNAESDEMCPGSASAGVERSAREVNGSAASPVFKKERRLNIVTVREKG